VGLSTVWAGRIVGVEAGARGKATSCVLVYVQLRPSFRPKKL
jgi:hypothetical protein